MTPANLPGGKTWYFDPLPGFFHLATILVPICLHCLNCTKFGQFVLRKAVKIVAPNSISIVVPPQTPLGELTALSPDP